MLYSLTAKVARTIRFTTGEAGDWWFGLRDRPVIGRRGDAHRNQPAPYGVLSGACRALGIGRGDTVYDIGCGYGRASAVFARTGARVVAIDIDPGVVEAAKRNGIPAINADARQVDYTDATLLWLFNPFGADTLAAVLARAKRPGLRAAYLNPQYPDAFARTGFREVRRVRHRFYPPIVIYEA